MPTEEQHENSQTTQGENLEVWGGGTFQNKLLREGYGLFPFEGMLNSGKYFYIVIRKLQ